MAITVKMAKLILVEHKYRPIQGNVLLLGKQTVFMTVDEAKLLIAEMDIPLRENADIQIDKTTMGRSENLISDKSFFSLFTDALVETCDVSDYEGADYIFDLSEDVPDGLINKFDFIYNGSVLDNVFDPAASVKNISRMLKVNGVVFHYEGLKHAGSTYLKFTPEWFFDYYAVNQFAGCQVYLLTYHDYFKDYSVVEWDSYVVDNKKVDASPTVKIYGEAMVVCVAEKAESSTVDRNPIQFVYRSEQECYIEMFQRALIDKRRIAYQADFTRQASSAVIDEGKSLGRFMFRVKRKLNKIYLSLTGKKIQSSEDGVYAHELYTLGHRVIGMI